MNIKRQAATGREYTPPCCEVLLFTAEENFLDSTGIKDITEEDLPWSAAPAFPEFGLSNIF